jgi:hypothetical protein
MPERIVQVMLTYTTWRKLCWIMTFMGMFVVTAGYLPLYQNNQTAGTLWIASLALGFPILGGLGLLNAVAKWQFAHSRARLIPGYRVPHLAVWAAAFTLLLVANPICLSVTSDQISVVGALAFTLLLAGTFLWGTSAAKQIFAALMLVIFLSAMTETGFRFWFAVQGPYTAIHGVLLVVGALLVVGWLWHLARLHEEMDDYQVVVAGTPWNLSRLERAVQRRAVGRQAARAGVIAALADRWHDRLQRLPAGNQGRPGLLQYGFGRLSGAWYALFAGLGFVAYGLFFSQLSFTRRTGGPGPAHAQMDFLIMFALVLPTAVIGLMLQRRLPRLSQELLRPASRGAYFDGLFLVLAKQAMFFWLALQAALAVIVLSLGMLTTQELGRAATMYTLLSLALQVPAFGWFLWVAKRHSIVFTVLGAYVSTFLQMSIISLWWWCRESSGDAVFSLLAVAIALAGWLVIRRVRQSWLNMELG